MRRMDWGEIGQLELGLDVETRDDDECGGGMAFAEVHARSEAARLVLDEGGHWGDEVPGWFEHYLKLRELGFTWRICVYIAWAASPKVGRWPQTQRDLATQVLGLTGPRQISEWRKKYPGIDDAITMMQAAPLMEHRADRFRALNVGSLKAGVDYKFFNHLKLAMEMFGDYVPRSRMDFGKAAGDETAEGMSEEELRRYAGGVYSESAEGEAGNGDGAEIATAIKPLRDDGGEDNGD